MGYRMIFSDMDGTLLRGTSELSYRNQTMIQRAMKQGIDFVICTGRGIYGVEPFLKQLNAIGQKAMSFVRTARQFMIYKILKLYANTISRLMIYAL